jgi:hypothetical protein
MCRGRERETEKNSLWKLVVSGSEDLIFLIKQLLMDPGLQLLCGFFFLSVMLLTLRIVIYKWKKKRKEKEFSQHVICFLSHGQSWCIEGFMVYLTGRPYHRCTDMSLSSLPRKVPYIFLYYCQDHHLYDWFCGGQNYDEEAEIHCSYFSPFPGPQTLTRHM